MSASDAAVLAATIGSPTVAAVAILANMRNSRGERQHARELARSTRWFDTRREVYEEALRYMHRALRQVTETHDEGIGIAPPGEPLSPDEEMRVQVRMEIFGAPEVTNAAKEFFASIRAFDFYARMRDQVGGHTDHGRDAQRDMNKHRDDASDQVARVEVMMRDELANL